MKMSTENNDDEYSDDEDYDDIIEQQLQDALDDDRNKSLLEMSNDEIKNVKHSVIYSISAIKSTKDKEEILNKLDEYMYVDQADEFKSGAYIRWISLTDETLTKDSLNRGAFFCNIQIGKDECFVVCKKGPYYLQFAMDECIIFQKLSQMDQLLLEAISTIDRERRLDDHI